MVERNFGREEEVHPDDCNDRCSHYYYNNYYEPGVVRSKSNNRNSSSSSSNSSSDISYNSGSIRNSSSS